MSIINKLILTLLTAGVLVTSLAYAGHGAKSKYHDHMVKELELDAEQEAKFREIMKAKHERIKAFNEAQHNELMNQLKDVLTEKQLAEFEELRKQKHHHMHKHKHREKNK